MTGNQVRLFAGMLLTTVLVTGCAVPPKGGQGISQGGSIEQLIAQADRAQPIRAAELRIQAAKMALQMGDQMQVSAILQPIDRAILPPNLRFEVARLQAGAAIEQSDAGTALSYLNPAQFGDLSQDQQAELSLLRSQAYGQQSNSLAAALELVTVAQNQIGDEQRNTHAEIWKLLQQSDTESLVAASFNNYGFYQQGWIELTLSLSKSSDLSSQRDALLQWQKLWEAHPANTNPPEVLSALLNAELLMAKRIMVALPFSKQFAQPAEMIAEGVAAARYARAQQGLPVPELISVDTEQFNSAADLMAEAQSINADLIIGPLKPNLIDQLSSYAKLPVPTLVFNPANTPTDGLYQLDLSSDQEVRQVVERAIQEGAQRFAVVTPAAPWGQKIKQDYLTAIEQHQGQVATTLDYDPTTDLSAQVSQLLNTDQSDARYREIRRILGQKPEFDERPRRDIDAILLTAQPQEARQIKPMLAYHFAGSYPVYASSHLYEGDANATRDIDLNGIRFPDIPWTLNAEDPLHLSLATERTDTYSRLGRLYALGIDAFDIHPYLLQLAASRDIYVDGQTGRLNIDTARRVQRHLTWAVFDQGLAVPLGPVEKVLPEATTPESAQTAITEN